MKQKTFTTNEEFLRSVESPEQTSTYKPILHGELIDLTRAGITEAGFTIEREDYSMAANGKIANGRYLLANLKDGEMQIQIAWQNSYNKSMSLKWAIGIHVFICGNGAVSGDMGAFKKKHVGDIQEFTPKSIAEYLLTANSVFVEMQGVRDIMKRIPVSLVQSAELLGRLYFIEDIMGSKQLNIIKNELEHPTHDYSAPNTLWELYNYVTYALKTIHPTDWMSSHEKAHKFFMTYAGIIVPENDFQEAVIEQEEEKSPYKQLDWTEEVDKSENTEE
jgi:hypothetical protein